MLTVAIIGGAWLVVAILLMLISMRGGDAATSRRGVGAAMSMFVATAAVFGIAVPLVLLTNNHANASAGVGKIQLTASEKSGRQLFSEHCAVCHTLAAANAVGKVGPDLDLVQPSAELVLNTITNGCLPNASSGSAQYCLGYGVMPAGLVAGHNAQDVAAYVAAVAGQ